MTLEQWSQWITWGMSLIWLGLIVRCWYRARFYANRLYAHESVLNSSYRSSGDKPKPFLDPLQHLQVEGWQASAPLSRYDMIAYWRAAAQADKQRMSSYIEMMPQFGLLGTVLSLFFSAFLFEFNMTMLGFALATTVFGLIGALWARSSLEVPSESSFFNILELLQNEEVVSRLVEGFAPVVTTAPTTESATEIVPSTPPEKPVVFEPTERPQEPTTAAVTATPPRLESGEEIAEDTEPPDTAAVMALESSNEEQVSQDPADDVIASPIEPVDASDAAPATLSTTEDATKATTSDAEMPDADVSDEDEASSHASEATSFAAALLGGEEKLDQDDAPSSPGEPEEGAERPGVSPSLDMADPLSRTSTPAASVDYRDPALFPSMGSPDVSRADVPKESSAYGRSPMPVSRPDATNATKDSDATSDATDEAADGAAKGEASSSDEETGTHAPSDAEATLSPKVIPAPKPWRSE